MAQELKYHERLGIPSLSISRIKKVIKNDILDTFKAWEEGNAVEKQAYHIVGPAGVGKTQICSQIAQELSETLGRPFELIMIKAPVLSRDDFILPFPTTKDGTMSYAMLYSQFVPKDPESCGLFVIDECSRGDHQLQQLLWQIQNECAIHRHKFPDGWFIISTDNPDDSEYSMNYLEDAAGIRRQLHLYVEVNTKDFLEYATQKGFHPYVVEFIQAHPNYLYDFEAQKSGAVYANPASYERLSDHLLKMEARRGIDLDELQVKASGLLNTSMAGRFISFVRDRDEIKPKDVFFEWARVKGRIEEMAKNSDNARLGELAVGLAHFLMTSTPKYGQEEVNSLAEFLSTIGMEAHALFISTVDEYDKSSPAFKYIANLNVKMLMASKAYKEAYDAMNKVAQYADH